MSVNDNKINDNTSESSFSGHKWVIPDDWDVVSEKTGSERSLCLQQSQIDDPTASEIADLISESSQKGSPDEASRDEDCQNCIEDDRDGEDDRDDDRFSSTTSQPCWYQDFDQQEIDQERMMAEDRPALLPVHKILAPPRNRSRIASAEDKLRSLQSFKCIILGDVGVGKTCIANRVLHKSFSHNTQSTIAAAFSHLIVPYINEAGADEELSLQLWDTAGSERYRTFAPIYFRGAKVAIVVFAVNERSSLDGAKSWIDEVRMECGEEVQIALVGNKSDLESEREVETQEAEAYAIENKFVFVETSALDGRNTEELFSLIAQLLPKESEASHGKGRSGSVHLAVNNSMSDDKSGRCWCA